MINGVKVSSQEQSISFKSLPSPFSAKSCLTSETFMISPINDVKDEPIFQVSSQDPSKPSKSLTYLFFSQIMFDLDKSFRIGPLATTNIVFNVKLDPILQISSQEQSTSSKPNCNQNLFLNQSSSEL